MEIAVWIVGLTACVGFATWKLGDWIIQRHRYREVVRPVPIKDDIVLPKKRTRP